MMQTSIIAIAAKMAAIMKSLFFIWHYPFCYVLSAVVEHANLILNDDPKTYLETGKEYKPLGY